LRFRYKNGDLWNDLTLLLLLCIVIVYKIMILVIEYEISFYAFLG